MADSNITKKALAQALKELMGEMPFDKIKISDICEKCGMNRKSFYYHFKDKYDLVNWIFDVEFFQEVSKPEYLLDELTLRKMSEYFYENRDFYRRALRIEGQNSFREHFRDILETLIEMFIKGTVLTARDSDFYVKFYTDGIVGSVMRWLKDKDCMPPDEFNELLETSINITENSILEIKKNPSE